MTILIFNLVGGIGLFLLGMLMLTDGLKAFAGDALRRALIAFTDTPFKAFASGTVVTALVQSSSATTVTVIGFVSAGLITFPQALGVVFGASLGTTGTSWIVSGLGLKISVGFYALPVVGIGAFLRLLGKGRWRSLGLALAGFGLIFIGIDTLQEGMGGVSEIFDLSTIPSGGLRAHVLAMTIGIVLTVLMQSSSAAVATTLTALHAGAINFEQAASIVIGAAVGTTVTGALAAIGSNVPARRTALGHVLFNLINGLIAIALLPLFLRLIAYAQEHVGLDPGAMSLAAFHTAFIVVGVIIFLPFVHPFARAIERILPDPDPGLTRHLDASVLQVPAVALEATRRALSDTAAETFAALADAISGKARTTEATEARLHGAMDRLEEFFPKIPSTDDSPVLAAARVRQLHAMDHLTRLQKRLSAPGSVHRSLSHATIEPVTKLSRIILLMGESGLRGEAPDDWLTRIEQETSELAELRRRERPKILERTAGGAAEPALALDLLDAMRWLDRLAYHAWRICHYLAPTTEVLPAADDPTQSR